jgi:hypothetical protein
MLTIYLSVKLFVALVRAAVVMMVALFALGVVAAGFMLLIGVAVVRGIVGAASSSRAG